MTYKIPMYYVVKVRDVWDGEDYIKNVEYIAGPFSTWDVATDYRRQSENNSITNRHCFQVATHYVDIEVEL